VKTPLEIRADENHEWFIKWTLPQRQAAAVNEELREAAEAKERKLNADKIRRDQYQREKDRERYGSRNSV
jgi:hypothetical protein